MDNWFHPTLKIGYDYLVKLIFKATHVCERGPGYWVLVLETLFKEQTFTLNFALCQILCSYKWHKSFFQNSNLCVASDDFFLWYSNLSFSLLCDIEVHYIVSVLNVLGQIPTQLMPVGFCVIWSHERHIVYIEIFWNVDMLSTHPAWPSRPSHSTSTHGNFPEANKCRPAPKGHNSSNLFHDLQIPESLSSTYCGLQHTVNYNLWNVEM